MLKEIHIYRQENTLLTFAYDSKMKLEYILQESVLNPVEGIYFAKVVSSKQSSKIAFINYVDGNTGLLNLDEKNNLQNGSNVLCQMNWRGDNDKLAKFTEQIKLIGRYIILLAKNGLENHSHAFSKKMQNHQLLQEISQKFSKYKLIFRSNCDNLHSSKYELIEHEVESLIKHYNAYMDSVKLGKLGLLILGNYDYLRLIRNSQLDASIKIITNCLDVFNVLQNYANLWQLNNIDIDANLQLSNYENQSLAMVFDTDVIMSKQGSNLICHKLSGINLIDINSDKSGQNSYNVNYLLCEDIVDMIKARDLSGIIIIDFIKNITQNQKQKIIDKLESLLFNDWRKSRVLGFTNAGLCEIIRSK